MRRSRLRGLLTASSGPGVLDLGGGGKKELVSCPVWTPQAQASEPKDSFEMGEQHLNLFPKTTGSLVFGRCGESASDVSSVLVQITRDLAGDRVRAALRFEFADVAIQFAGAIEPCALGRDATPWGCVIPEVIATDRREPRLLYRWM
jgi:hypothetical protein